MRIVRPQPSDRGLKDPDTRKLNEYKSFDSHTETIYIERLDFVENDSER